jgi:hypothetical protein
MKSQNNTRTNEKNGTKTQQDESRNRLSPLKLAQNAAPHAALSTLVLANLLVDD